MEAICYPHGCSSLSRGLLLPLPITHLGLLNLSAALQAQCLSCVGFGRQKFPKACGAQRGNLVLVSAFLNLVADCHLAILHTEVQWVRGLHAAWHCQSLNVQEHNLFNVSL